MEKRGDSFWGFRNNPFIALASAFGDGRFVPASPFPWGLVAPSLLLYVVLVASPHGAGWIFVPVTLIGLSLISIFQPGLEFYLLMIFALVSWFPEFSQSDFEVYSADEFASLYNYRPIPGVTASLFDYLFAAIVLGWLWRYVIPAPRQILKAPFAKPMLFFLSVWTFSLAYGLARRNETYYALREFRVGAYFVLAYLMVVTVCQNRLRMRRFLEFIVGSAAVVGAYGIVRYMLGLGQELAGAHIVYYDLADSVLMYTAMLIIASFAIGGIAIKSNRVVTAVLTVPMLFSFLFSYRRGSWLAFIAGLAFLVVLHAGHANFRRFVIQRLFLPAALIVGAIAAIPAIRNNGLAFVLARFNSIFDVTGNPSNVFRILDALNALSSFIRHPILGIGVGGRYDLLYGSQSPQIMEFMDRVSNASHNGFLFVLFKSGLVGFCAYFLIFVAFFKGWFGIRNLLGNHRDRAVWMALGAVVISILVNDMFDPVSDTIRPSLLMAFVMGWGAAWMARLKKRPEFVGIGPALD